MAVCCGRRPSLKVAESSPLGFSKCNHVIMGEEWFNVAFLAAMLQVKLGSSCFFFFIQWEAMDHC